MDNLEEKKQEIENCEHNLKLLYEAKKSALETMLRNIIPTELAKIKTVLWMNFLIMGLITKRETFPNWFSIDTGILVTSGVAVSFCLYAFVAFREKKLGTIANVDAFSTETFPKHEWSKYQALVDSIYVVEEALAENIKFQTKRSDLTAIATLFSMVSMLLVIIKYSNQL